MESLEGLSLNDKPQIQFAKKKQLSSKFQDKKYIDRMYTAVTSFATFNFTSILSNLYIYGINVENRIKSEVNDDQKFPLFLIRKIFRDPEVVTILHSHFIDYILSGNTVFARAKDPAINQITIYIYHKEGELRKISEDEADSLANEDPINNGHIYTMTVCKRIRISDYKPGKNSEDEIDHIKRYINLVIADSLKKLHIKRADMRSGYDDLSKADMIPVTNNYVKGVYFFQSYKINTGRYENNNLLLKIAPKFRMIREETYMDRYQTICQTSRSEEEAFRKFADLCRGRSGITTYSSDRIQIDDVIFKNPAEITFTNAQNNQMNLITYYQEKYKVKLDAYRQPIFVRRQQLRNRQSGLKEEKECFYLPQLLYIAGRFEEETIKIDSILKISPTERMKLSNQIMEKITRHLQVSKGAAKDREILFKQNMNFKPIEATVYVLNPPSLKFDGKTVQPDCEGKFPIQGIKPYRDDDLKNWLFLLIDTTLSEAFEIYKQLQNASIALNVKIPEPQTFEIKHQQDPNGYRDYFYQLFNSIHDKRKENKIEFIVLIISKYVKTNKNTKMIYSHFKDCAEKSKMTSSTQVLVKDTAFRAKMSYYTYVLFQIWAKRNLEVWGIKTLSKTIQSKTIVAAFALHHNPATGKSLTSLCLSFDSEFTNYYYYSEYNDSGNTYISSVLATLLKKALTEYIKHQTKYGDPDFKVSNLIIYREGLNEAQRRVSLDRELTQIFTTLSSEEISSKMPNVKVCLIFVNNKTDIKYFELVNKGVQQEGVERFTYLNSKIQVENAPVGSLLESVVVSQDRWEFYLNSALALSGTSNPTHYLIGFDNTELEADFIYKMTFNLTFIYYNNNKSVRVPAPLHNIIRRNKFIISHLTSVPKSKFNVSL